MKPKHIETRTAVAGSLVYAGYAAILAGLPAVFVAGEGNFGLMWLALSSLVLVGLLVFAVRAYETRSMLQSRALDLENMAAVKKWTYSAALMGNQIASIAYGAPLKISDARNQRMRNFVTSPDWKYVDLSYDLYGEIKGVEYKRSVVYYSVMAMDLPRALPNVLFDSKKARRRQFKAEYDKKQCHSLEGNFDNYFATYFVNEYTIDSLSFITPEVMQKLIDASDYDVEIIDNQVLLYGPLLPADIQLKDMEAKLGAIKKALLHNILTYRDERLPYEEGRKRVSSIGARLKRPGISKWVIAFVVLYIVAEILSAIFD